MAQVRHVVRWRSPGAAVTFLLAAVAVAVAGVARNQLTGRLTPALVMFAVLVVAGVRVTNALERSASARGSGDAEAETGVTCEAERIDLRGARGVQTGDHNRPQNYFGPGPGPGPDE